jgi:VWFA-related protein
MLRDLAVRTGGKAFFPARDAELPLVQGYIHDDVVNRYLLTYTPKNQRRDGSWRAITVHTGEPKHVLRTRDGYRAPAPAPIRPVLEFTAVSSSSQPVVLGSSDLEVREDGVLQSVTSFSEAVAPVSIIIALDESGSMKKSEEDVRNAALSFVDAVRDEDRIGVVKFSNSATLETDLTQSRVAPKMTIQRYTTAGGTALYDAVALGVERLATQEGRKAVVLLTDGRDENAAGTAGGSRHTLAEVLDRLREVDATVFAIGLGPNVDTDTLQRLADFSGGTAYFPQAAADLPAQYARVLEDLRRRYTVSYASTNTSRDGKWRDVTLKAVTPGIILKSRGGYRAPAQ